MNDTDLLQGLADRQAITELIYRYCRAVDRLDHDLGYSIWHEDAIADYGDYYKGDGRGLIDLICTHHEQLLCHSHQVANILIDLQGDHAASETYVTATLRMQHEQGLRQISVWSRYIDCWSRRNGRWGLDHRLALRDFDEIRDITPLRECSDGKRDRSDPSYTLRR
jgi:hypothetical protein